MVMALKCPTDFILKRKSQPKIYHQVIKRFDKFEICEVFSTYHSFTYNFIKFGLTRAKPLQTVRRLEK
jgi:hypothetical protein